MFANPLPIAGLALLLAAGALSQAQEPATLEQRFAAWKLQLATGVPAPSLLTELEGLLSEASASGNATPQLEASMAEEAAALRSGFAKTSGQEPTPDAELRSARAHEAAEREVLRLAVEQAVRESDANFLRTLGKRAVPALKAKALAWDGAPPPGEEQPALQWLAYVSPEDALDVALVLMQRKSFLLKRSALRALETRTAFKRSEVWKPEGETNWRLKNPEWIKILTLALEEPAVSLDALKQHFEHVLKRGQLPQELGEAAMNAEADLSVRDVFPTDGAWYLERLAKAPNPDLRKRAAWWMPLHGSKDALQALALDPVEDVQESLARGLLVRSVERYDDESRLSISDQTRGMDVDEAVMEAVVALVKSPFEDVRKQIAKTMAQRLKYVNGSPFTGAQVRRLFQECQSSHIHDPLLLTIQRLSASERLAAVEAMIESQARLDEPRELRVQLNPSEFGLDPAEDFFSLLQLWKRNGYLNDASEADRSSRFNVLEVMNRLTSEAGLKPDPFVELAQRWEWFDLLYPLNTKGRKALYPWCAALSDEASVRLVETIYGHAQGEELNALALSVERGAELGLVESTDLLSDLATRKAAPIGARTWAVLALAATDAVAPELRDSMVATLAAAGNSRIATKTLVQLSEEQRQQFQSALIDAPEATPEFLQRLHLEDLDDASLERFLERAPLGQWVDSDESLGARWTIVYELAKRSVDALDPRLTASKFSHEQARFAVMSAASATKNPALLPLIKEFLLGPHASSGRTWEDGVNTIGQYFNAEAAEALLELAKEAPFPSRREQTMATLAQITQWREAAAAWQKSSSAALKRDSAIRDLVALLDAEDQSVEARAAALKGLGLLGAVEELPRIIANLSATEPALQEAARAALAR
ncbi:MAG: hypothetical protein AAGG01_05900, partial [Planctomycetota bacterium]